jgi:3-phosphoshikimate 1-carboxyvinyltransferase
MVGAAITEGSDVILEAVGINPTRTGVIEILKQMGADLTVENERIAGGEPIADIHIKGTRTLKGIHMPEDQVPLAIDEFPALFIAAACAEGQTILTGAAELRVKESDRIQVMADGLKSWASIVRQRMMASSFKAKENQVIGLQFSQVVKLSRIMIIVLP